MNYETIIQDIIDFKILFFTIVIMIAYYYIYNPSEDTFVFQTKI